MAFVGATDPLSTFLGIFLNIAGLIDLLFSFWSLDLGNASIVMSVISETVGVASVILGVLSGFPGLMQKTVNEIGDKAWRDYFMRYGCEESNMSMYYPR